MRAFSLESDRLGFFKWDLNDVNFAKILWGDPLVSRYICRDGVFSESEIEQRLLTEVKNGQNVQVQYWPLFLLETGEFVGC